MEEPVLKIEHLNISFLQYTNGMRQSQLDVIRDLDVEVNAGEMVAVVGSSGSGKSLLAHAVLGILPYNAARGGRMTYRGSELTQERIEKLRGSEIVMVPQSLSYLDPLVKIGKQIRKGRNDQKTVEKLKNIFRRYDLKEEVEDLYPFELSGGMNRRILISTALIEEPKLVIADEPTPGLDLKVAKRAMGHFRELADLGAGVLVITHDLELALETADRVVVFYAGCTVEEAASKDFIREETLRHPYTKALWRALPQHGFQFIEGVQPYVKEMPEGCPFSPRCGMCTQECRSDIPYRSLRGGRVRCLYAT
ncbi:ABC transporter ATP-binding protein [Faecalicatena orotica]|uniref:Nickel import system ATP-binding protein NikD n=1 Tax=Faecalicatena orotica TaxID=1544 RepID=A0A2Y9BE02_9FIRM|nr:ABC transporter ATP-binding protein [Faecalicatena orotica]PWJ31315.1 peptide/nickel transport system ATP-binding protein [Faecalicatena orotica]SSA54521.1 peptide/nickel transport system ATP-binding protein [Faecalicatena orotica]